MKILFVCTGNSCRSVMAAEYLKKRLQDLKISDIKVSSAGTGTINGLPASPGTMDVLKEEGIDAANHRSTSLNKDLINKTDLIYTMTHSHLYNIIDRVQEAKNKTFLLDDNGVSDPIGGPMDAYKRCFDIIKKNIEEKVIPGILNSGKETK